MRRGSIDVDADDSIGLTEDLTTFDHKVAFHSCAL